MDAIQRRTPSLCPRHKGSQSGGSWGIDQVHKLRAQATIKLGQVFFFFFADPWKCRIMDFLVL